MKFINSIPVLGELLRMVNFSNIQSNLSNTMRIISTKSILESVKGLLGKFRDILKNFKDMVTQFIKSATSKPKNKKDYLKVGSNYLSKRLIAMTATVIIVGGGLLTTKVYPWADGKIWRTSLQYGSDKFQKFSGDVKVLDNGKVIYIGKMNQGKLTGYGRQYDTNDNLIYDGMFENDMYLGNGTLYENGTVVYKGSFSQNTFEGIGEQYDLDGKIIYRGSFSLGQRTGSGIEYDKTTSKKIYSGDWIGDKKEGQGEEFKNDGKTKIYKGSFVADAYEGRGCLYEDNVLKYSGDFVGGKYEGSGVLYGVSTGKVIYEGDFVAGEYEGKGKLFDTKSEKVIYHGDFIKGKKEGKGETYDKLGAITYSGDFNEDDIAYLNYIGKSFNDISTEFGKESFKIEHKKNLICTYLNKNISMIFVSQEEDNSYICKKILINMKDTNFKGVSKKDSKEKIEEILGKSYSSINYRVPDILGLGFESLSVEIKGNSYCPSDKFIMEDYFIRLYYDQNRENILSAEISFM